MGGENINIDTLYTIRLSIYDIIVTEVEKKSEGRWQGGPAPICSHQEPPNIGRWIRDYPLGTARSEPHGHLA
jgi:hypothetical protein